MTTKQGDKREAEAIEAIINEQATQGLLDALVQHQAGGMPLNAGLAAWSREQLSGVDLGNARRHRRFCAVLTRMAEHPQGSLPIQCRTSAELKGAYRAMRFPKVHAAGLMASHHSATMGI